MKTVKVYIERSQYGYSAYMDDTPLDYSCLGEGKTVEETINDINNAYNEMREHYAKEGKHFEEIIYEYEVFDKAKQSDIMEERGSTQSLKSAAMHSVN